MDLCDFVDLGRRSERADADRKHEIHGSRLGANFTQTGPSARKHEIRGSSSELSEKKGMNFVGFRTWNSEIRGSSRQTK